jgi:hypothetical protein
MRLIVPLSLLSPFISSCYGSNSQQPIQPNHDGLASSADLPYIDESIEVFIQSKMKQWHVPGLAIGILDDNKTWFKAGTKPPPPTRTHELTCI